VDGIGEIAFQQSAGFLRIPDGDNPLDNTSIHPESYEATNKLLEKFGIDDVRSGGKVLRKKIKEAKIGRIVFDRNGYKYHGRVKALTEAIRSAEITI